jgi:D-amino-acid oxidase
MLRRDVLLAGASVFGVGCAGRRMAAVPPVPRYPPPHPVEVSPQRVIRTVAGLRPYRPSGFVVRRESLGAKALIHNYGHGGGGITLCWGTGNLAVEEALQTPHREAAVLGCGAVGLATARLLQRKGFSVTIYTKDTPPDTTSNIAGGYWSPVTLFRRSQATPAFLDQYERAARFAHRYFQSLTGDYYGVRWLPMYVLASNPINMFAEGSSLARIADLFPDARQLSPEEHPFPVSNVLRFWAILIEPPVFLNALQRDFLLNGGKLVIQQFENAAAVAELPQAVIVNCTGLGARALFHDEELMPIKGQLSFVPPDPRVDYGTLGPGDIYMFPRRDGILLGGTHEDGEWSLEPSPAAATRILGEHQQIFGAFKRLS